MGSATSPRAASSERRCRSWSACWGMGRISATGLPRWVTMSVWPSRTRPAFALAPPHASGPWRGPARRPAWPRGGAGTPAPPSLPSADRAEEALGPLPEHGSSRRALRAASRSCGRTGVRLEMPGSRPSAAGSRRTRGGARGCARPGKRRGGNSWRTRRAPRGGVPQPPRDRAEDPRAGESPR